MGEEAVLRIGEVAKRTDTTVSTLRAWERRYELLEPGRTDGGHRLYSATDVRRVRAMRELLEDGWSAAAAARQVRNGSSSAQLRTAVDDLPVGPVTAEVPAIPATHLAARLVEAFDEFDTAATNEVIDLTLARFDLAGALEMVLFPALRSYGDGWQDDPRIIAREHFATNVLRPRLTRMVRSSSPGGWTAVAAAPVDEDHDIGLLGAAAVLSGAGWAVRYLGARTPRAVLEQAVREADADIALVAATRTVHAGAFLADPPDLDRSLLVVGGTGFAEIELDGTDVLRPETGLSDMPRTIETALRARS